MNGSRGSPGRKGAIESHLVSAEDDFEIADFALPKQNPLGAFHVQQAAEKMVKALRASEGLPLHASHDLDELLCGAPHKKIAPVPEGVAFRDELLEFVELTRYATTFRYPTPSGKPRTVDFEALGKQLEKLKALHGQMKAGLLG